MESRYQVPHTDSQSFHRTEQIIKHSRFITSTARVSSKEDARLFIDSIRREFPDATHNCWAFEAGSPGDTAQIGYSDDGEPHGTAGRPMLSVLLHSNIGEIACVVTRYFGGIKLGTGGLVRAYQDSVYENLKTLPTQEKILPAYLQILLEYGHIEHFRYLLRQYEASVISEEYTTEACFKVSLPQEKTESFTTAVNEATNRSAYIEQYESDTKS